jgi:hypothetical protein
MACPECVRCGRTHRIRQRPVVTIPLLGMTLSLEVRRLLAVEHDRVGSAARRTIVRGPNLIEALDRGATGFAT